MASIGALFSGVSTCSALCASFSPAWLPLPSGGRWSPGSPTAVAARPGTSISHSSTGCGGRDFREFSGGRPSTVAGWLQGHADGVFLCRLVGRELRRGYAFGEVRGTSRS
jgi:hypothetical protein